MRALFAGLLLLVASTCFAQILESPGRGMLGDAAGPEFLPVEEAYQLEVEILDAQQVRLYWQIADNYYLYQHRFDFVLEDSEGSIELATEFPPALERSDEYFGEVQVYYQQPDIILQAQRKPAGATLTVTSQGCADAGLCYPPRTQHFEVDLAAAALKPVEFAQYKQGFSMYALAGFSLPWSCNLMTFKHTGFEQ